jgi:ADP-heptose:LPS heptosyltransferase
MNILFVNYGSQNECLLSTCVIKGIKKYSLNTNISVLVKEEDNKDVFKWNENVKNI